MNICKLSLLDAISSELDAEAAAAAEEVKVKGKSLFFRNPSQRFICDDHNLRSPRMSFIIPNYS